MAGAQEVDRCRRFMADRLLQRAGVEGDLTQIGSRCLLDPSARRVVGLEVDQMPTSAVFVRQVDRAVHGRAVPVPAERQLEVEARAGLPERLRQIAAVEPVEHLLHLGQYAPRAGLAGGRLQAPQQRRQRGTAAGGEPQPYRLMRQAAAYPSQPVAVTAPRGGRFREPGGRFR